MLTLVVILYAVGVAVGAAAGVLYVHANPGIRVSRGTRRLGWCIWTLRIGGYVLVALAGFLFIGPLDHSAAVPTFAMLTCTFGWDVPIWLHNRCVSSSTVHDEPTTPAHTPSAER